MTSDEQTTHLQALRNDLVERRRLAALDLKVGATTADLKELVKLHAAIEALDAVSKEPGHEFDAAAAAMF